MTNEQAIKQIIKETCGACYGSDEAEKHRCSDCGYRLAAEALANQQWIPISESLPEIEDLYLVQTDSKYGGSDGKGAMDIDKFSLDEDGSGYWNYWPNSHSGKTQVIAWMPLPEPYKEEEE